MKEERNIVLAVILSIVTLGIYNLYWFVVMTNEVKEVSDDDTIASGGLALLFTIVTCGIYGLYLSYKMGKLMFKAQERNNLTPRDNSIIYLILYFLGLGIINQCIIQSDLNEIIRNH